ncbi:MAG: SpoIVB peptidase [Bacilli bacterium]|nr:SpoIVB peptidase [Bacilli bacterium]
MFFKNFKTLVALLILSLFIIPINVFAYSDRVLVCGETIGITKNSKGILIVGIYDVDGNYPAKEAGLKSGDIITSIDNADVKSIEDMADKISNSNNSTVKVGYLRDGKRQTASLKLYKDESNVYKTGLFVKDSITGIGTLTFIDPETKIFGALGHEIQEQSTGELLEIKDGKIFNSNVTGVIPSSDGNPGEKKAEYDVTKTTGDVSSNTTKGIFGNYTDVLPDKKTYEVAQPSEINEGKAKILTVLDGNNIKEYEISITKINKSDQKTRNFVFEITDETLLSKTNGIIQGMSGSPIIQNNKIIGAVTHVVVDNPHKGYGIFITNMLEEAEK